MHGRVVIGLLAYVIEQRHGGEEFVPARLTVDMFRLPNIMTPVEIKTKLIRDGLRIRVVEAEFISGGVSMARASCQLLRRTENPEGQVWSPPNWDVPKPADIPAPTDPRLGMNGKWTTRPIVGAMGTRRPAAAVDERSARPRRGRAADAVRAGRGGGGFRQPVRQCRRPGPRLHQQRRHAVSAPPAGDAMDRVRGGEPPRHRRHRDRRVLALRREGADRDVDGRSPGAAQADDRTCRRRKMQSVIPRPRSANPFAWQSRIPPREDCTPRNDDPRIVLTHARCRFISGRAFNAAPCLATILAMRSGAKFMSTKPVAVLATS